MNEIEDAVKRSVGFLLSQQDIDGSWRNFSTSFGEGVDWPTAYVGYHLLDAIRTLKMDIPTSIIDAAQLLLKNERNGGWGHNTYHAIDSDSTSWVLSFFNGLGLSKSEIKLRLLNHRNVDGSFSTFINNYSMRKYLRHDRKDLTDWCRPHMCVMANILISLYSSGYDKNLNSSIAFIAENQKPNGSWKSYWWDSDIYATYHCIRLLSLFDNMFDLELEKAMDFISSVDTKNSFELGLKIKSMILLNMDASEEVTALLSAQNKNGSWESDAILCIPNPSIDIQEDHRRQRIDKNGLFSTATCASALADFISSGQSSSSRSYRVAMPLELG